VKFNKLFLLFALMFVLSTPIFAADAAPGAPVDLKPLIPMAMAVASGLCGLAQGKAVASAAEAIARNPGATGGIRFALLIGLVLIESLALYTLIVVLR
jgi:F-type H+-transporting ATPase subunit c